MFDYITSVPIKHIRLTQYIYKLFFRYECHTFNFDFSLIQIFSAPSNMTLVYLFCFTTFFKFTFSKKFFFVKKTILEYFLLLQKNFFFNQKILLKTPYIQNVRDPTLIHYVFCTPYCRAHICFVFG